MTEKTSFSDFEKAAMKERAAELRREQENKRSKKNPEADVLEAIAEMSDTSAQIASHLHEIMHELAPNLTPKTWYGMPAYADEKKQVVVYFKYAEKFDMRYGLLCFNDQAQLDAGEMWPVDFAIPQWSEVVEAQVRKVVAQALSL
ncbi:DUF1801 domain-containing protein [Weissella minor]|uniref:YdhG-like domain-containing protein n=1 Tax=Weissella minor TaxID=1620 RepID=A0A0R2JP27_9LACO|nr:DUF1801 domain-containing protein [Weissella minor]KRN77141.1 hypothetical protein IV67_GL000661 [Weissella minor]